MGNGKKPGGEYAKLAAAVAKGVTAGLEPHLRKLNKLDSMDGKLDSMASKLGSMERILLTIAESIGAIRRVSVERHLTHEQRIRRLEKLAGIR